MAIDIWGTRSAGRHALLKEAETIVNNAIAGDQNAPMYAAVKNLIDLPIVRPGYQLVPRPQTKGAYRPTNNPDPDIIAELVSRATAIRSRRWSVSEQRVRPLPKDWRELSAAAYPQMRISLEYSSGWVDLMLAATAWINERETGWYFSDAKEKFGSLRLSTHGLTTPGGEAIIDAAEHLGSYVCQVCGGVGGQAGDYITLCVKHREDKEWRKTGHI